MSNHAEFSFQRIGKGSIPPGTLWNAVMICSDWLFLKWIRESLTQTFCLLPKKGCR